MEARELNSLTWGEGDGLKNVVKPQRLLTF